MPTINFDSLAIALGLFFTFYQLRQNWRMSALNIEFEFKKRFDGLNEDRKDFQALYKDPKINLRTIKNKDEHRYYEIINWESRYFHYEFDKYVVGHKRRIVPSFLKNAWDCSLKSAMQHPIHQQAWELEISKEYFLDKDFYAFIKECAKSKC